MTTLLRISLFQLALVGCALLLAPTATQAQQYGRSGFRSPLFERAEDGRLERVPFEDPRKFPSPWEIRYFGPRSRAQSPMQQPVHPHSYGGGWNAPYRGPYFHFMPR